MDDGTGRVGDQKVGIKKSSAAPTVVLLDTRLVVILAVQAPAHRAIQIIEKNRAEKELE